MSDEFSDEDRFERVDGCRDFISGHAYSRKELVESGYLSYLGVRTAAPAQVVGA